MERCLRYTIGREDEYKRIDLYLKEHGYSKKVIVGLKEAPSQILLNQDPVFVNKRLKNGDFLEIYISEEESSPNIIPEMIPLNIIYEDEDLLVVSKPAGMPIHPSVNHHTGTLANGIAGYYKKQGISYVFRCLNRLDRDTSGLVLLAKNPLSGAVLSKCVKECGLHREYRAVVCGKLPQKGTIAEPIGRRPDSIVERMVDKKYGQKAVTHYERLSCQNGYSYASIQLETGRTHQIRVHMKYIGHPLPGDFLYYPDFTDIKRQALHSYRIWFPHPITGKPMEFVDDIPEDMKMLINKRAED